MTATALIDRAGAVPWQQDGPFDLDSTEAYRRWREAKLERQPRGADDLRVEVRNPRALNAAERAALLQRLRQFNMAIYCGADRSEDPALPLALGAQLGLRRLDANALAGEDGLSRIEVAAPGTGERARGEFIPYTDRAIGWHTDGYYHPPARRIQSMILHAVRPARRGGDNDLLDPDLAYIALRDAAPDQVRALMRPDAMTIPAYRADDGSVRAAQSGPVFSCNADGSLHMRYTARTRSIAWRDDPTTRAAAAALGGLLAAGLHVLRVRLEPGTGLVAHNVLHTRSAFEDDPAAPRLVYRARYLDRCTAGH